MDKTVIQLFDLCVTILPQHHVIGPLSVAAKEGLLLHLTEIGLQGNSQYHTILTSLCYVDPDALQRSSTYVNVQSLWIFNRPIDAVKAGAGSDFPLER